MIAGQVNFHVDQRARQIFDRSEALIERRGLFDLIDQRLRYRFTGLIVNGKFIQNFRRCDPMLKQLRREFDIIGRDICARKRRVGHV